MVQLMGGLSTVILTIFPTHTPFNSIAYLEINYYCPSESPSTIPFAISLAFHSLLGVIPFEQFFLSCLNYVSNPNLFTCLYLIYRILCNPRLCNYIIQNPSTSMGVHLYFYLKSHTTSYFLAQNQKPTFTLAFYSNSVTFILNKYNFPSI